MSFAEPPDEMGNDAIRGVANGIVTDNKDPDGMGRVKLTFPWRAEDGESYWARMATTMAGTERGTYFLPEVGDEVLVAFEDGNIHYPYVLGALWSSEERPPEDNADGKNDVRTIRSRSGHEITLNDSDTAGNIEITTNSGHTIVLDDSTGSEKIHIADRTGKNTVDLDSNTGSIDVSSAATVNVESTMINIKGKGNVSVEAGGILTLKGSIVKIN
ncbi:phage baseplate assembly protein V [Haladaptatus sp. NG-SE-30]